MRRAPRAPGSREDPGTPSGRTLDRDAPGTPPAGDRSLRSCRGESPLHRTRAIEPTVTDLPVHRLERTDAQPRRAQQRREGADSGLRAKVRLDHLGEGLALFL